MAWDYKKRKEFSSKKIQARRLIQQMLLRGKIEKDVCFFCGKDEVEAHHIFYDYPKKVLWLCKIHHREFHKVWKENKIS